MKWVLVAAAWMVIAIVAAAAAAFGVLRTRLRARHRINPKVDTQVLAQSEIR